MHVWRYLRFAASALLLLALWPSLLCAQMSKRLEQCLPYPTLAQEITARSEGDELTQADGSPGLKRSIVSVKFEPETRLPVELTERIVRLMKLHLFYDSTESDWLGEVREVAIRGPLQDAGFFRAYVEVYPQIVSADPGEQRYSLTVDIEPGPQYRLNEIRFVNVNEKEALAFPASELREHFRLRKGDLFSVSKIREGMNEVAALYGSKGYIDFTMEPETTIEDGDPIDLVMKLNEEKQYRVGKVEFWGLNERTGSQLTPQLKPGEVFNNKLVDELLSRNRPLLPPNVSRDDVSIFRHIKDGTVDVRFDFYRCHEFKN
jgi:outer membrane protein assembly factor BamA